MKQKLSFGLCVTLLITCCSLASGQVPMLSSLKHSESQDAPQFQHVADFKKYDVTEQQVIRLQEILQESASKIAAIADEPLPAEEFKAQRAAIKATSHRQIVAILSPAQKVRFEADFEELERVNRAIKEIIKEYNKEHVLLRKQQPDNWTSAKQELSRKYEAKLLSYTTADKAQERIRVADIAREIRRDEIRGLKLSYNDARRLGELKLAYQSQRADLGRQTIPWKEYKIQKRDIETTYRADVKRLIGDVKYAQWLNYVSQKHEQRYRNLFGFTPSQYNKYKDIENKMAVDIKHARKSVMPQAEKRAKIAAIKAAKVESLRSVLSAEQFAKWHKSYLQKEQQRAKNKKR